MKGRLGNKIARTLTSLAIAGGLTGCSTLDTISQSAFAQSLASQAIATGIDASIRNKIEGPRGTTVNVYNNPHNQISQQGFRNFTEKLTYKYENGFDFSWACNDWIDDGNGQFNPIELKGFKTHFRKSESILLGASINGEIGDIIKLEVIGPDGELAYSILGESLGVKGVFNKDLTGKLEQTGKYTAFWYSNNALMLYNDFEIIDN